MQKSKTKQNPSLDSKNESKCITQNRVTHGDICPINIHHQSYELAPHEMNIHQTRGKVVWNVTAKALFHVNNVTFLHYRSSD